MSATKNINAEKIKGNLGVTSVSATTISGTTFYGDGSNLTGIPDNFVTGGTFSATTLTLDRQNGSVIITGFTSGGDNTFVTGFTYNDANTFTISDNAGSSFSASINTVTGLTTTSYIDFDTQSNPSNLSGRTFFDSQENALSYYPETLANDVTINIGQESVIKVYNGTGLQINNGQACHIDGSSPNGIPSVILAIATGNTSTGAEYEVSGVATHDIPNGTEGFITAFGLVRDLNITGITEGNEIYLSDTTPGELIYSKPTNIASRLSQIGWVIKTGATDAKILVEIENEVGYSDLSNSLINVIAENNSSTGTRNGGEMTINSGDNTLFDISAGSGIIVDNYTDPNNPTITNVVWGDITGNTVTNLTGATASFIFLDSNLNTVQFANTNPPTEADYRDNIYLGILGHANFTSIINAFNAPTSIVSPINQLQDLTSSIGPFSIGGNRIQNITGTLKLLKTEGRSYFYGGNFHTDNKIPSSITTAQLSASTLVYATGANVLGPTSSDIDPNNYDSGGTGTITAIPGVNAYVAHRIWHNPQQNLVVFQYGQDYYPNAATARDEFEFENFVVPAGLNDVAYLVAVIIAQDGDTDLDSATIIPQGKFAGTGGGGGSVADTLQTAYDNSSSPEILTDSTRGAVDFKVGSGSDSDNLVTFQQNSGTINAFVEGTGDAKFESLSGDSLTILSTPNLNNSGTDILLRNSSTGEVEYRPVSGITPDTNTFVTGFTYNNSNEFNISDNSGSNFSATINSVTGFTINGDLTVRDNTRLSGLTTVYGDTPTSAAIAPGIDNTYDLGQPSFRWREIYTTNLDATNAITSNSLYASFNIESPSISGTSISASTIYSGSTDLYDIFLTTNDGNDITRVQPGTNINTGGTANNPVVNLDDDISLNSVFATTLSGGTLYSGSTDLTTIIESLDTFVTGSSVSSNVLEVSRNDAQQILQLSGGSNIQFVDNGSNSITLNATTSGGGASVSFPWKFKEPTASSDPGSGHFRLNNTVASAITEIYVSDETNNSIDASNLLNILDVGDVIYVQQNDDATRALLFTISASTVDNTGWFTIPVQYQQGSTIPKKDKVCGWIFASTGAEDNTVSNVGVGQGVFKQRNVNDFEFYSLSGGSNTTLSLNDDTIVIDVTNDGNDITRVQPGTNITTGGTANEPVVNLTDNVVISSLSATTISGGTIYIGTGTTIANETPAIANNQQMISAQGATNGEITYAPFRWGQVAANQYALYGTDETGTIQSNDLGDSSTNTRWKDIYWLGRLDHRYARIDINNGTDAGILFYANQGSGSNGQMKLVSTSSQEGLLIRDDGAASYSLDNSAIMELVSTSRGFLPPKMTTIQRDSIATPASGLIVYDTNLAEPLYYDGSSWISLEPSSGVTGSGTSNTIPIWNSSQILADSIITYDGSSELNIDGSVNITGNVEVLGTATTINTQSLNVVDNDILLNSGGTHTSAIGGGIFIEDGISNGNDSTWTINSSGQWSANTSVLTQGINVESGVMQSGGTDLYNIFLTTNDGNDITRVQPGVNINTGGTENNPVVNLDDDISLNSVSGNTLSGGTIYSGSTDLYNIFATSGSSGESNTASNLGSGEGVFAQKIGVDLQFKSLTSTGTSLSISSDSTTVNLERNNLVSVTSITGSSYSAITSDEIIGLDTTSLSPTLFLPDSTTAGKVRFEIKDIGVNARTNPITIQAVGSDTIITTSVVSSTQIFVDGGSIILVSTGSGQWWQM